MAVNKSLMDKISQGRQYRSMQMQIENRANDEEESYIVKGYATTFNEPYTLYAADDWEYREQVSPDAFSECDMSDTIFQFDHEGRVYARISNKTLNLEIDSHGLLVTADLSSTPETRELYEEIKAGLINKMSFGFTVNADEETRVSDNSKDIYTRTITRIGKLYDVSAVSIPANDGTEISARSLIDGVIAKRMAEAAKEDADKKAEEEKRLAEEKAALEQEQKEREMRERERLRALALLNI